MLGINWGLIALTGECGVEVAQAGIQLAQDIGAAEEMERQKAESIQIGQSFNVFHEDDGPVLKLYYQAQSN